MSLQDTLFGSTTSTDTYKKQIPSWVEGASRGVVEEATRLADQPYQPYGGQRLAEFTPAQEQAFGSVQSMQGIAGLKAAEAGERVTGEEVGYYMNPYLQQVAGNTAREMTRASDIRGQGDAARAVMSGAFGGSRHGLVESERERNLNRSLSDMYTGVFSGGYDRALGQANQYRSNLLAASQAEQGMNIRDINAMMGIGSLQQQQGQRGLDIAYGDFQQQQQYPYEQLGFVSNMLQGVPYSETTKVSGQPAGPGAVQGIAGLGMAAYGQGWFGGGA